MIAVNPTLLWAIRHEGVEITDALIGQSVCRVLGFQQDGITTLATAHSAVHALFSATRAPRFVGEKKDIAGDFHRSFLPIGISPHVPAKSIK